MDAPRHSILYWAPRILGILFALFTSIFALDVFQQSGPWSAMLVGLLLHLIPTIVIALLVALAWRHDLFGAAIFPALGVLYIIWAWGRFPWFVYALMAGPLFVLGILFLLGQLSRRGAEPPPKEAGAH